MPSLPNVLSGGCNHDNTREVYTGGCVMGLKMEKHTTRPALQWCTLFIGIPLLFYLTGDFPRRSILKETISLLTLMAFFQLLGQLYTTRCNTRLVRDAGAPKLVRVHKIAGYIGIALILVHPLLIVVPRYFEAGIGPGEAFLTMVTTTTPGVLTGLASWGLMLALAVTSLFQKRIPLTYLSWRRLHASLSIAFIPAASWHVANLGRHASPAMTIMIVLMAAGGMLLTIKATVARRLLRVKG
ncbi:ferric reductase-like transmembrane domain-containing protein [Desulfosediminicola ganghwensis]|uniref:ferric reductase-like transmembrane domain-containing protein n=1 Tax=Desulfosediminicola ganghwensis TaxID=2569540 RepID=UPI0010AD9D43|nr:ferric reductase-like transmembrane domain-containing protein [Desulfosediminicola ganghwensis]